MGLVIVGFPVLVVAWLSLVHSQKCKAIFCVYRIGKALLKSLQNRYRNIRPYIYLSGDTVDH